MSHQGPRTWFPHHPADPPTDAVYNDSQVEQNVPIHGGTSSVTVAVVGKQVKIRLPRRSNGTGTGDMMMILRVGGRRKGVLTSKGLPKGVAQHFDRLPGELIRLGHGGGGGMVGTMVVERGQANNAPSIIIIDDDILSTAGGNFSHCSRILRHPPHPSLPSVCPSVTQRSDRRIFFAKDKRGTHRHPAVIISRPKAAFGPSKAH